MRIKSILLSWFRGAATPVSLEPNCMSMVVYGVNGSGKSSFVDAIEYVQKNGKIGHLAHEYSGKNQEKGIPNTHRPKCEKTEIRVTLKDGNELGIEIKSDGSSVRSGAGACEIDAWEYHRTVLRQDEVANFIHATKGGKYSALLPLLGLHPMEVAAENLRQLGKSIDQQAKLSDSKTTLRQIETKKKATFGTKSDVEILEIVEKLHSKYCQDKKETKAELSRCEQLEQQLNTRIAQLSTDGRRHIALQGAAHLSLKIQVDAVRAASVKLASVVEPLITEKLEILEFTNIFVNKLEDKETEVTCPACGRAIPANSFQMHVNAERKRLEETIKIFNDRRSAIGALSDTVKSLKSYLGKADVQPWRDQLVKESYSENFLHLDSLDGEALRTSCEEEHLKGIEDKLLPLIAKAAADSKDAPPDAKQLSIDKHTVEVAKEAINANDQVATVIRAESLISFIKSLEEGIRKEIRSQSKTIIAEISADIRVMWDILHPGKAIEDICLYVPKDADKAIDIRLKFYDVDQDSPRLTLSEGYRNGLGLCIFLAMAKREGDKDRPLFLDDVVVSFDRLHRGMVVGLIEKEFSKRQVVILTHDREWYTELRQLLDEKTWVFKTLLPYESPDIGIRWSHKTTTFADARGQLKDRPDSAGNDARKIMDVELSFIADRLQLKLPYMRAEKNDKRTAHDFLVCLIADGKSVYQKKFEKDYVIHSEAIEALEKADRLLLAWGNRASHSFDIVRPEATKLIDACEKALDSFKCLSCDKRVTFTEAAGSKWVQCQCGNMRWQYGKT
ncbi:MAG: AAA family ATPase [Nitrospira sp.]|nr:AAA family ATPase [Nitrospira sp.]